MLNLLHIANLEAWQTISYRTRSSAVAARETARRFVSLNILLSHSRSLKIIRNDTVE